MLRKVVTFLFLSILGFLLLGLSTAALEQSNTALHLPMIMNEWGSTPTPTPTSTPTNTPTSTPSPTATSGPTITPTPIPPPTGTNVNCRDYSNPTAQICAWVSNGSPSQNSNVTTFGRLIVNGSPVAGAQMHTVWHYKTTSPTEDCITGSDGIGRCTRNIGRATTGYQVRVDVEITHAGTRYTSSTSFTPQ